MKDLQQSNRKHKTIRDKLKKKRADLKAHKKDKKMRKKNPELRQNKLKAARHGIDLKPLREQFKRFLKSYRDQI